MPLNGLIVPGQELILIVKCLDVYSLSTTRVLAQSLLNPCTLFCWGGFWDELPVAETLFSSSFAVSFQLIMPDVAAV